MSAPRATTAERAPWFLRPKIALPILAVLFVILAVLTPESSNEGRAGDSRLSTFSRGSQGASLLQELAGRLGWKTERRLRTTSEITSPGTIEALLAPPISPTAGEVHLLLEHVRRGGALLYLLDGRSALSDSLHVNFGGAGMLDTTGHGAATAGCAEGNNGAALLWPTSEPLLGGVRLRGGPPAGSVVFVRRRRAEGLAGDTIRTDRNVLVGYPYGAGRIVVGVDADVLRNDVLRVCRWGLDVAAVRALEYLRDGGAVPRTRIVFDEYHQGYGLHPGSMRGIMMYLGDTRSGRVLAQLFIASLVLLVAAGMRTVPPRADHTVERRSPLEHVDALAHAYAHADATRVATQRLLRGVRRRVPASARAAGRPDREFLDAVQSRHPVLRDDVAAVRRALDQSLSARELEHVGSAMHRIETTLSSSPT